MTTLDKTLSESVDELVESHRQRPFRSTIGTPLRSPSSSTGTRGSSWPSTGWQRRSSGSPPCKGTESRRHTADRVGSEVGTGLPGLVEIGLLPAGAAGDAARVAKVTRPRQPRLRGREGGLWLNDVVRTRVDETADAVAHGQLAVTCDTASSSAPSASGSSTARPAGSEPSPSPLWRAGGRGIGGSIGGVGEGRALCRRARAGCSRSGSSRSRCTRIPIGFAWYRRLGYREVEHRDVADLGSAVVFRLAAPCEVVVVEAGSTSVFA